MWYKNVGTGHFLFVTMHAFDRQTDRQTAFSCYTVRCTIMQSHGKKTNKSNTTEVVSRICRVLEQLYCSDACPQLPLSKNQYKNEAFSTVVPEADISHILAIHVEVLLRALATPVSAVVAGAGKESVFITFVSRTRLACPLCPRGVHCVKHVHCVQSVHCVQRRVHCVKRRVHCVHVVSTVSSMSTVSRVSTVSSVVSTVSTSCTLCPACPLCPECPLVQRRVHCVHVVSTVSSVSTVSTVSSVSTVSTVSSVPSE